MIKFGGLTIDKDGNVLSEKGLRYEAAYEYNGQNRMTYSEVTSHADRTHTVTMYEYDALGRRTLTQSVTGQAMRTLYDGKGFEVIREGEAHINGSLTTRYATGTTASSATGQLPNSRYRWIGEDGNAVTTAEDGYAVQGGRYGSRGVTLYGNGEAIAISYSSSTGGRSVYLGKDILGSVKTATSDGGALEDKYEYDAFGTLYRGDLSGGMNLGYLGKPYDSATGLYNYGYRDYSSQAARFMTADPVRDGNNWYAYVNNDPVNWVDLWGLVGWEISTQYLAKTGVEGARLEHLGIDWVYTDADGKNATTGQYVYSYTVGTVSTGNDPQLGKYVRVTGTDGLRTDYFHLETVIVVNGATVQAGTRLGTAGNTGSLSSGPHLHVAQSYPRGKAPEGVEVYNPTDIVDRSYIKPPTTAPQAQVTAQQTKTTAQRNKTS